MSTRSSIISIGRGKSDDHHMKSSSFSYIPIFSSPPLWRWREKRNQTTRPYGWFSEPDPAIISCKRRSAHLFSFQERDDQHATRETVMTASAQSSVCRWFDKLAPHHPAHAITTVLRRCGGVYIYIHGYYLCRSVLRQRNMHLPGRKN